MTGLTVSGVNVYVQNIYLPKEEEKVRRIVYKRSYALWYSSFIYGKYQLGELWIKKIF